MGRRPLSQYDAAAAARSTSREIANRILSKKESKSNHLPNIHFAIGERNPVELIDQMGAILVNDCGLAVDNTKASDGDRWYFAEEKFRSNEGTPVTTVHLYSNNKPSYTLVRKDQTNQRIQLQSQNVVSLELRVENMQDVPAFVLDIGGIIPKYESVREFIFEFADSIPLVNDSAYIEFVSKFREPDVWLMKKPNK